MPDFGDFDHKPVRAFLVSDDPELRAVVAGLLPEARMTWTLFNSGTDALEEFYSDPPGLLVVDDRAHQADGPGGAEFINLVKSENVYRQTPTVWCVHADRVAELTDPFPVEADELLPLPAPTEEIRARLLLTLARAERTLDANPLTKLPGNTSIIRRIQAHIDRKDDFALAYVDLDNFKAFNDKYGFSRGDEALMMTARVLVNGVRETAGPGAFVGHVGGDDFVFTSGAQTAEAACKRIIETFDAIAPSFYDADDRKAGVIQSVDREGKPKVFPLMSLSIGVVFNRGARLAHYGEASADAVNLKKKAKEHSGSCYILDRRGPEKRAWTAPLAGDHDG